MWALSFARLLVQAHGICWVEEMNLVQAEG